MSLIGLSEEGIMDYPSQVSESTAEPVDLVDADGVVTDVPEGYESPSADVTESMPPQCSF